MYKTLTAAAIALLATTGALAQSSVTVYGRVNLTAEQVESNGIKTKQLVNNASRLGFKGVEDLGGGLRAGFLLEHRFDASTGVPAGRFYAGGSEVYLGSNSFGTIRLGQFISDAYFATADYVSMHNHDTGNSEDKLYAYLGRNTNKIGYRTPELVKGLTAEASASATEGAANTPYRNYDGAINYQLGKLAMGLGYEKAGPSNQFAVRGLYDFGAFILGGYVQRHDDDRLGDRMIYRISGAVIAGASEFHLNYGHAEEYKRLAGSDADQFTVAYNYNLSKRTKVYAFYTKVDDSRRISGTAGDFNSFALGMRHNF